MPTRALIAFLLLLAAATARDDRTPDPIEQTIYLPQCETSWYATEENHDSVTLRCTSPVE